MESRLTLLRLEYQLLEDYQRNGGSPSFSLYSSFPYQYNHLHVNDQEEFDEFEEFEDRDDSTSGESTLGGSFSEDKDKDWK